MKNFVSLIALVNNELQEGGQPRSLTYLGNVGTKQFFVADSLVSVTTIQLYSKGFVFVII